MLKNPASRTLVSAPKILLFALLVTVLSDFPASAWGCTVCVGSGSDVYVRVHIVIEDGTMNRLDVHWDLSETLAQALVKNHDRDRDGRLDSTERLDLNEAFVGGLRAGSYHTALIVNAQERAPLVFENPRLEWQGSSPRFMFSIPLQEPVGGGLQLRLRTHDPEQYLQFYHRQDSVTWNEPACCRLSDNSHLFPRELEMDVQPRDESQEPG